MLKLLIVRSPLASLCAWLLVLCGVAATWPGGNQDVQMLADRSIVIVGLGSVILGPWWFVSAVLLRPLLLPRIGWFGVAPIECISLCAYDIFPWRLGMIKVDGLPGIVHEVKVMSVFYAAYLAVSVLLLYLLSRFADRKTSPPAN
jgi:hypothetical protein